MMFAILQHYGILDKIVSAIRVIYDLSTSQVYIQGQLSEPFAMTTGCTSTISIHHRDRLNMQIICLRCRLSHSQRE